MAASLWKSMTNDGTRVYYDESFRNVLEAHLSYLKNSSRSINARIPEEIAIRNEYDFFGVLLELGIQHQLHWLVMRMNGFYSPTEYTADTLQIIIPDQTDVDAIRTRHTTIHKI